MKYAVIAIFGWSPSRQCWMTRDNEPSHQVIMAICKTKEQALTVAAEVAMESADESIPDWETPFVTIKPMRVRLPGFE